MARQAFGRIGLMAGVLCTATLLASQVRAESNAVSFKEDVMPILEHRCQECHVPDGAGYKNSGLLLNSYQAVMKGTKLGPVITPGKPMTSNLLVLVEGKAAIRMPHNKKPLTKCEIDILRKWVQQGAKDN